MGTLTIYNQLSLGNWHRLYQYILQIVIFMSNNSVGNTNKLPLRLVLIAPFLAQILTVAVLAGGLSLVAGQDSDSKKTNHTNTILLCLGALGVGVGTSLYTSRWISKPMRQLTAASNAIAAGKLDRKIEVDGIQEAGLLAESLNKVQDKFQESIGYLENINEQLEIRIEETGAELQAAQQAKELAEASSKTKDSLLGNMGRALRNPIDSILEQARSLQTEVAEINDPIVEAVQSRQIQGLKVVEQRGNNLLSLIDDILDFSRIESNQMQLEVKNVHFPSLLTEIVESMEKEAQAKNITFKYETNGSLPSNVKADKKRLQQVLTNLLSNSIRATTEGQVTFTVSVIKDIVAESTDVLSQKVMRFEVINTGDGEDDSGMSKIFKQSSNLESQKTASGLSLAVSKQIIGLMGSELQITHQAKKGSIYWFDSTFLVTDTLQEVKYADVSEMVHNRDKKHKILVVDDIEENRQLLIDILEPMGFEISIAENGREGIEIACKTRPDLILTDLFMGVKTGFSMVKDLRGMPTFKNLPIIAISASSFEVVEQKSRESGCDAFLQKPIDQSQLLALLVKYLKLEWVNS